MATEVKNRGFDWKDLLIGILYIIAAFIFFSRPAMAIGILVVWFGVLAIIKGINNFIKYSKVTSSTGINATFLIITGVLDILLGIILLFNLYSGIVVVGWVFAIWFITDSIAHILNAGFLKERSKWIYWISIIFNVICVLIGVSLFFNPIVSALTVPFLIGFYFLIFGIEEVISSFA